jgi:hypothetical protein
VRGPWPSTYRSARTGAYSRMSGFLTRGDAEIECSYKLVAHE